MLYLSFILPSFDMTFTGREFMFAIVMIFIDGLWWAWILSVLWDNYKSKPISYNIYTAKELKELVK